MNYKRFYGQHKGRAGIKVNFNEGQSVALFFLFFFLLSPTMLSMWKAKLYNLPCRRFRLAWSGRKAQRVCQRDEFFVFILNAFACASMNFNENENEFQKPICLPSSSSSKSSRICQDLLTLSREFSTYRLILVIYIAYAKV